MFAEDDQARQQLKASIVRQAVTLSSNRLQVHVAARYRSVNTSFTVASAMGTRTTDLVSGYADAVMFGVIERYEEGLAALLDARLAAMAKGYVERAGSVGPIGAPYAEFSAEIEQLRVALRVWGDEGRADWRHRNPWSYAPSLTTAHAPNDT